MPDSRRPQRPDNADVLSYEAFGCAFFRQAIREQGDIDVAARLDRR